MLYTHVRIIRIITANIRNISKCKRAGTKGAAMHPSSKRAGTKGPPRTLAAEGLAQRARLALLLQKGWHKRAPRTLAAEGLAQKGAPHYCACSSPVAGQLTKRRRSVHKTSQASSQNVAGLLFSDDLQRLSAFYRFHRRRSVIFSRPATKQKLTCNETEADLRPPRERKRERCPLWSGMTGNAAGQCGRAMRTAGRYSKTMRTTEVVRTVGLRSPPAMTRSPS